MTNNDISSANGNTSKKLTGSQWGLTQFDQELESLIAVRQECRFEELTQEDAQTLHMFAQRLQSVTSKLYLTCKPNIKH